MQEVAADIERRRKENRNWYDLEYNRDATQRADAQRMLARAREEFADRNRRAAGSAAVTGATNESLAATREANARGMADAAAQIAVAGEQQKERVQEMYRNRDDQLRGELNSIKRGEADNIVKAAQGVSKLGGDMASGFDDPTQYDDDEAIRSVKRTNRM